jgi:hypothetical protein
MLAIVVQVLVAGFHNSAGYAGFVDLSPGGSNPLVPPVTRTLPSGSNVALWSRRPPVTIDPVYVQAGVELFKSIISAVAVGSIVQVVVYAEHVLPPITSTLPLSYITDEPQLRSP